MTYRIFDTKCASPMNGRMAIEGQDSNLVQRVSQVVAVQTVLLRVFRLEFTPAFSSL